MSTKDTDKTPADVERTNLKIVSSPTEPVYTVSTSVNNPAMPTVTETPSEAYAKLGQRFSFNTGVLDMGTSTKNNSLVLQVTTPPNWGKTLYMDRIRIGSKGSVVVDCMPATLATSPAAFSCIALTAVNTFMSSTKITAVTAVYAVGSNIFFASASTPILTSIFTNITYEQHLDGRFIIPGQSPATNYCIKVSSDIANANGMISFSWWEI